MYRSNSIVDEIKDSFKQGSTLTKLIYTNLGLYLLVTIAFIIYLLFIPTEASGFMGLSKKGIFEEKYLAYLMASSDLKELLFRPWTIITYMFLHFGFLHLLFNMLILFWFGRIFLKYLNQKQLLTTYILGGIIGLIFFVASYNLFPGLQAGSPILGASAAVMAIVLAISFYAPNYTIHLLLIGPVKIKYIAIAYVVLDFLRLASGENIGGYISHMGGALYGYTFAMQLKRGKDIGRGFSHFMDALASLFQRKPKMKVSYKSAATKVDDYDYNRSKVDNQKEIDRILDKIAKSGYESLSKKEKETLFRMSNKS